MTAHVEALPAVAVIVLAYGPEPYLRDCLTAVLSSRDVDLEVVVVDNGCTSVEARSVQGMPGVRWLVAGSNTGFAGGCNLGVAATSSPFLAFVNSDAIVEPDALRRLVGVVAGEDLTVATGLVTLADSPDTVNAAGNPVHWSGLSWAGGYGDSVARHLAAAEPASASGALLCVSRGTWDRLGGFSPLHFAYLEDAELSLRCWLGGGRVVMEPRAVARHHYEFSRNERKMFLLERNRWVNLLTLFERRTLWSLLPGLLLVEAGVTYASLRGGWFSAKREAWEWLVAHREEVGHRRRQVFGGRRVHDDALLQRLSDEIAPGEGTGISVPGAVNRMLAWQGRLARRLAHRRPS